MIRRKQKSSFTKRKKKYCPFKSEGIQEVDYKDVELLSRFITERGKILPRRITGVSAYFQKKLTTAIKQARYIAILPYVAQE